MSIQAVEHSIFNITNGQFHKCGEHNTQKARHMLDMWYFIVAGGHNIQESVSEDFNFQAVEVESSISML